MPRLGVEFPPPYGKSLPWPSDIDLVVEHKEASERLYCFWIELEGKKIEREELLERVNRFFRENFQDQDGITEWLEGDDPKYKRPRAVLIKEKALQDRSLANGKRHNPPSASYASLS